MRFTACAVSMNSIDRAQARDTWLYVLPWDLKGTGGVNQVVQNLFDRTDRILDRSPLLVVTGQPPTGQHRMATQQAVVTLIGGRPTAYVSTDCPWPAKNSNRVSALLKLRFLAGFLIRLPIRLITIHKLLAEQRVTTINVHFPGLDSLIWSFVRRITRRKVSLLVSLHGADLMEAAASTGFELVLWRLLLGTADKLVLCSETLEPRLASTLTTAPGRVTTITPGVDIAHLLELSKNEPTISLPSMFIYSVGTYESKKGHDVLIDAFELIAAALPDVWLIIAGRRAEPEFSATALRQQRSIAASRILLLTDVPHRELIAIMGRATVFALPSRDEPFGIVVLEAGALKIPVVATTVCGAAKDLKSSINVKLVQPDDAQSLANSLTALLTNKVRSAQMGINLYNHVYAHNSWEASATRYGALLRHVTTR